MRKMIKFRVKVVKFAFSIQKEEEGRKRGELKKKREKCEVLNIVRNSKKKNHQINFFFFLRKKKRKKREKSQC